LPTKDPLKETLRGLELRDGGRKEDEGNGRPMGI